MGVFIAAKNKENAEFSIASAILDAREDQSGASDEGRGRGGEVSEGKPVSGESPPYPVSLVTHSISAN